MHPTLLRKIISLVVIATAVTASINALRDSGFLTSIENRSWDLRVRATTQPQRADSRIKIILIDQASLSVMADESGLSWPWPRAVYGKLVSYLAAGGAKGVAFDMLFTEPSGYDASDDKQFAASLSSPMPVVVPLALQPREQRNQETIEQFLTQNRKLPLYQRAQLFGPSAAKYQGAVLPTADLLSQLRFPANASVVPDSDGTFRRFIPAGKIDSQVLLSIPLALYGATLPVERESEWTELAQRFQADPNPVVRFYGAAETYEAYSMAAILQSAYAIEKKKPPSVPADTFQDSWVFVGVGAPGLFDIKPTAVSESLLGIDYLAAVFDNIIHRNFVKRVSRFSDGVILAGIASIATGLTLFLGGFIPQLGCLLSTAAIFIATAYWLVGYGIWISLAGPLIAIFASALLGFLAHYEIEGRAHRFLRSAFQQYLSPTVIDQIVKRPELLGLSGERREITVLFSDIKSFTSISEALEPTKLAELLNEYLSAMTDILLESGGTLDKYIGDAILCFWNAPLSVSDHQLRGVRAAIECVEELMRLQDRFEEVYGVKVEARIGVATGSAIVGNFGSKRRFDYTAIGDTVNLASRLESANKTFDSRLLISESTWKAVADDIPCRNLGTLRVVGKNEAIRVFEPIAISTHGPQWMTNFEEARSKFELGELEDALKIFSVLDGDGVVDAYRTRIELVLTEASQRTSWDPTWNLMSK